jgi:hypothetical protein
MDSPSAKTGLDRPGVCPKPRKKQNQKPSALRQSLFVFTEKRVAPPKVFLFYPRFTEPLRNLIYGKDE